MLVEFLLLVQSTTVWESKKNNNFLDEFFLKLFSQKDGGGVKKCT